MSYTDYDRAQDAFWADWGPRIARAEWELELLQSYFVKFPDVVKRPRQTLSRADAIKPVHSEGAVVFAIAALEVGLKLAFARPLIYGLIHRRAVAEVLHDAIEFRREDLVPLTWSMIADVFAIESLDHVRPGGTETLSQEIRRFQTLRNDILHKGKAATPEEASAACELCRYVLHNMFDEVLDQLELSVKNDEVVHRPKTPRPGPMPKIFRHHEEDES